MSQAAPIWTNWSGRLQGPDEGTGRLVHVRTEADAAALAASATGRAAAGNGQRTTPGGDEGTPDHPATLRVSGAAHSHYPLVPDQTIVDVSALSGVIEAGDGPDGPWATVGAGTPIHVLGPALHRHGLALRNQGDIDRQFIGGAVATGTHGTGAELGNLSSAVRGARIATAAGDLVDCSPTTEPELWQAARHNLGALGIVTRLTLALRPAYRLRERGERLRWAELAPRLPDLGAGGRHVEFFWYPAADRAVVKTIDETDDDPEYPLAPEGFRVGWNYEVLPNHRTWPHTEMEYSVPRADGPACLAAIKDLLAADFPDLNWPVEYRTLAADDVWLSTAYERPTVTISLHMPVGDDEEPLYRAAETVFRSFGGRPHWGKVHYLSGPDLADAHPCWDRWWAVRDAVDPDQVFLNDALASLRHPA